MTAPHDDRLTGWKEIAAYLRKDVRTVLRWERERGLPIHRPPGRRGQSVYAIREELDRWIASPRETAPAAAAPVLSRPRIRLARHWIGVALLLAAAAGAVAAWPRPQIARVAVEGRSIRAFDGDGRLLWTHEVDAYVITPSVENGVGRYVHVGDVDGDDTAEAIVSIVATRNSPNTVRGLLLCFDAAGRVRWSRELDDTLEFEGRRFTAPWAVADLMVFGRDRKTLAAAVHHLTWWPSMIVAMDAATGERRARYVHRGWIMRADVTADRRHVIAAAINNARDAQAVSVLDAATLTEQSYFVLPRPDASAAAREPLDRQHYWISQTGVPTIRFGHSQSAPIPETIVELSPDLRGVQATFSDSYWDWHRALERDGHLTHSAETCPERTGPRALPESHQ